MNPFNGGWVILLSLLVAMLLAVVHLPESTPDWLGWLRPNWLLLVLFFWVLELPSRIGLVAAWLLGLLVDALTADPLGVNGLIFAGTTYVAWRFYERMRMYSMAQQCGVIFLLVTGAELIRGFAVDMVSEREVSALVVLTAAVSMLVWPVLYLVLLRVKTAVRVE